MPIHDIMRDFDRYLVNRGHSFEGLIVGQAALELAGVELPEASPSEPLIEVIYPPPSDEVLHLAAEFAATRDLPPQWIQGCDPDAVARLAEGWTSRLHLKTFAGHAVFLHSLDREDIAELRRDRRLEGFSARV